MSENNEVKLNKSSRAINITSGDYLNNYLKNKYHEGFIPFREAMIDGLLCETLFEKEFNIIRAKNHHIDEDNYLNHMKEFYQFINNLNNYDEITLWFGVDAFCQINMLTILAYLDKVKYTGSVFVILIEDGTNKIVKAKELIAKDSYYEKYVKLMCNKEIVRFSDYYLDNVAKDYINLISDEGEIATLIKNNASSITKTELVELVWNKTRKYGLGDVQVFKIIEKYSNYVFDK